MSRKQPRPNPSKNAAPPLSRRKLWCFRLLALVGGPLLCFGLLELCLRLAGFGYPTAFLLKSSHHGEKTFVQNNQFGWRFFGPRVARQPVAISIPREKPPDTIRVFVFGESAAYGDPQPQFGLPRMLQALLELRHPDKKFEVVNAAMTAINSHVILPLARDCTGARADVWVIYMGNNEVVGPFGAGTVFGNQATPRPLIRAGLALKTTRLGQWLETLRGAAEQTAAGRSEWEGMRMFVKFKLAGDDPRLQAVYENFAQNLKAIIAAGQSSGAKIVLSTVAVNLKDCPPFTSLHQTGLAESQLQDWQRWFESGVQAQARADFRQAIADYDQAARIDDSFAELRFRRGQCALALQDVAQAQKEFAAACDWDALRFRCDSRLNAIIRQHASGAVTLADAERTLAAASPDGIPGADFFYEHVHFGFQGNYLLSRALAEKVETVLALPTHAAWPDVAACARRLGYTSRGAQLGWSEILGRLSDAPFTFQTGHDEQMRQVIEAARKLPPANSAVALREAQSATEAALARWPADAVLWEQLGEIKQAQGDYAGAAAAAERSLDLLPSSPSCRQLYGILLAHQGKYQDAAAIFQQVLALDPQAVWARQNFALCLQHLGRRDDAIAEFKRALDLRPNYGIGWLALGQLYEEMGRTNDATQCYNAAVTNRGNQADELATVARFCFSRRWFESAATNYAAAIELCPADPGLRLEAGRAFAASGQPAEAVRQYASAVELEPDQAQPRMHLGVELGRLGRPALAEQEFRQVLRINPESLEARANLGVALYKQEKFEEAQKQFEAVLLRNPTNATALNFTKLLRNPTPAPATP